MNPLAIILIGRSGCGKGTQAKLIIEYLKKNGLDDVVYIYTGDKIRQLVEESHSFTAELAKEVVASGKLLPSFMSVSAWAGDFTKKIKKNTSLIIDGSPRKKTEAMMMDESLEFYGIDIVKPIFIETSPRWSRERLLARKRDDDTEEAIKNRFDFFDKFVMPTIDYYEKESKNKLTRVNGEQSMEDVHKEIIKKVFNGDYH